MKNAIEENINIDNKLNNLLKQIKNNTGGLILLKI